MEAEIDFIGIGELDEAFLHRLFYLLVANGGQYNRHETASGRYVFLSPGPEYDVEVHTEESDWVGVERIPVIIQEAIAKGSAGVMIYLDFPERAIPMLGVSASQSDENVLRVRLETTREELSDPQAFTQLCELGKQLFERLDLRYGRYQDEPEPPVPTTVSEFLEVDAGVVNYYDGDIVERIGTERVDETPAMRVETLRNGGRMVLVCETPRGCEKLPKARAHLSPE